MNILMAYNEILTLFLIVIIGLIVAKKKIVTQSFRKELSTFLFYVSIPATMINSISQPFSEDKMQEIIWILMLSVGFLIFGALVKKMGVILLQEKDVRRQTVYEFLFVITNYGFMGWPVSYALFGDDGIFYSSVFAIPINISFYLYGSIIFSKVSGKRSRFSLRQLLTPPNIATAIGLLFFIFSISLPSQISGVVSLLSATTTPLAMAIAGMTLAAFSFRTVFSNRNVFLFTLLRLLVLPFVLFLILKMFRIDGLLLAIPVIIAAMPAPPNVTVLTEQYHADSYLAAQIIFITTLLSVVTIPLFGYLVSV